MVESALGPDCVPGWGLGDRVRFVPDPDTGRFAMDIGGADTLACEWTGPDTFVCNRYAMSDFRGGFGQGCSGYGFALDVDRIDGCHLELSGGTEEPSPGASCFDGPPFGTSTPD